MSARPVALPPALCPPASPCSNAQVLLRLWPRHSGGRPGRPPEGPPMWIELTADWLGQKQGARLDVYDADARLLIDGKMAVAVHNNPLDEVILEEPCLPHVRGRAIPPA